MSRIGEALINLNIRVDERGAEIRQPGRRGVAEGLDQAIACLPLAQPGEEITLHLVRRADIRIVEAIVGQAVDHQVIGLALIQPDLPLVEFVLAGGQALAWKFQA